MEPQTTLLLVFLAIIVIVVVFTTLLVILGKNSSGGSRKRVVLDLKKWITHKRIVTYRPHQDFLTGDWLRATQHQKTALVREKGVFKKPEHEIDLEDWNVMQDPGVIYVINESNGQITRNMTTASGGGGFEIINGFIFLGKYSKTVAKYNGTTLLATISVPESSINGLAYNNNTNELWLISHTTTYSFCFPEYTLISSPNGDKQISEFKIGDKVFSFNGGAVIEDKVINVTRRDINHYKNKLYEICTDRVCVNATYNHLFWTTNGYKRAETLTIQDILRNVNLEHEQITNVTEINISGIDVWDIDIEKGNTFFAEKFLVDENGKNENSDFSISIIDGRNI